MSLSEENLSNQLRLLERAQRQLATRAGFFELSEAKLCHELAELCSRAGWWPGGS